MGCCKCESQAQVCQGGETERHKHRNLTEEKDLLKRLNRIASNSPLHRGRANYQAASPPV